MSQWTHVGGLIRLDTPLAGMHPGNQAKLERMVAAAFANPPEGSEGPVEIKLHKTGEPYCMAWAALAIWGDLRDYDDAGAIRKWIEGALDKLYPDGIWARSVAVSIEVEGSPEILLGTPQTGDKGYEWSNC